MYMDFNNIIGRINPKVKAIAKRLNGRYTLFGDDDLYQEALLDLWLKAKGGTLDDKTDSFILQGVYFFLKNYIRKKYKKIDQKSISLNFTTGDKEFNLEDVIVKENQNNLIDNLDTSLIEKEAIGMLNQRQRKVLTLLLESYTTREIGQRLGVSHVMVIKIKKKIRQRCDLIKKSYQRR